MPSRLAILLYETPAFESCCILSLLLVGVVFIQINTPLNVKFVKILSLFTWEMVVIVGIAPT